MEKSRFSSLFGKITVQMDLMTREQVNQCIHIQREGDEKGDRRPLGGIAVEQGYIDEKQADRVAIVQAFMEARAEDKRFGEIAVNNAFLTRDQLADALEVQKKGFKDGAEIKRIGQILLEMRYVTQQQRDAVLRAQRRMHDGGS